MVTRDPSIGGDRYSRQQDLHFVAMINCARFKEGQVDVASRPQTGKRASSANHHYDEKHHQSCQQRRLPPTETVVCHSCTYFDSMTVMIIRNTYLRK